MFMIFIYYLDKIESLNFAMRVLWNYDAMYFMWHISISRAWWAGGQWPLVMGLFNCSLNHYYVNYGHGTIGTIAALLDYWIKILFNQDDIFCQIAAPEDFWQHWKGSVLHWKRNNTSEPFYRLESWSGNIRDILFPSRAGSGVIPLVCSF